MVEIIMSRSIPLSIAEDALLAVPFMMCLPFFFFTPASERIDNYTKVLENSHFRDALLVVVASFCPLILDNLFEMAAYCISPNEKIRLYNFLFCVGTTVPGLVMLLCLVDGDISDDKSAVAGSTSLFVFCSNLQFLFGFCLSILIINHENKSYFTDNIASTLIVVMCVGSTINAFKNLSDSPVLSVLSYLCRFSGFCLFIWCASRNLFRSDGEDQHTATTYVKSCIICTVTLTMLLAYVVMLAVIPPDDLVTFYIVYVYVSGVYFLVLSAVPMRVAKLQVKIFEDKFDKEKAFVQYVSHEARGPLNVANMGLELHMEDLKNLFSSDAGLSPQAKQDQYMHVQEIMDSCSMAITTLNDMLTFDKLERGMLMLEQEVVRVPSFIHAAVSCFSIQARYNSIKLVVLIDPAIYSVYDEEFTTVDEPEVMHSHHAALCADRHKMAQVLRNFISNALKFTQDNSSLYILCHYIPQEKCQRYTLNKNPSATEIIRSLSSGAPIAAPSFGRCRIEVRDNGPGLEEAKLTQLFGRYVQFDASKMQQGGGSGLGLWLSKQIIDMHGGVINAVNNKDCKVFNKFEGRMTNTDVGCCFSYEMPVMTSEHIAQLQMLDHSDNYSRACSDGMTIQRRSRNRKPQPKQSVTTCSNSSSVHPFNYETDDQYTVFPSSPEGSMKGPFQSVERRSRYPSPSESRRDSSSSIPFVALEPNVNFKLNFAEPLSLRVLIVDDVDLNRRMLKRVIDKMHVDGLTIQVEQASDGLEAISKVDAHMMEEGEMPYFDMIFVDKHMPNMGGVELVRVLRLPRLNSACVDLSMYNIDDKRVVDDNQISTVTSGCGYTGYIAAVTGDCTSEVVDEFMQLGASKVLTKPLKLEDIRGVFVGNFAL